ncbi:MAG: hypothetical protein Q4C75_06595 [Bergeyella zoohelcum]|nr:hypothetical protein [Bergeyella zoohelcum]
MKYNINQQIKDQLQAKTIEPSRNLWEDIEQQMQGKPKRKRIYPLAVAASLAFIVSTSLLFMFNDKEATEIVVKPQQFTSKIEEKPLKEDKNLYEIKDKKIEILADKPKESPSREKVLIPVRNEEQIVKVELPKYEENQEKNENIIIAKTDSISPKIKKKYTDTDELLFSVEHKEVIKNVNSGGSLAAIEFESKK